jgi:hypothetical protein
LKLVSDILFLGFPSDQDEQLGSTAAGDHSGSVCGAPAPGDAAPPLASNVVRLRP